MRDLRDDNEFKQAKGRMFKYCSILAVSLLALATPLAAQTPEAVAEAALRAAPVWDGHNDVPIQLRSRYGNVIADFDFEDTTDTGPTDTQGRVMHTDFERLAEGASGRSSGRSTSTMPSPRRKRRSRPSSRSTSPSG